MPSLEKLDPKTLDPERTVVVATGNAHKLEEIQAILGPVLPSMRFVALGQLGDFPEPDENGSTFLDNAIIKLGPGKKFAVNYDYCKGCGICANECPCGAIEMVPEDI